ncbi:unnamed protein product [Dicrocoelium dendriticum]|nr:unnamed protein product [Dicrocoelium dendriticum]
MDQKDCAALNRESRKQHVNVNRSKRTNLLDELVEMHLCTHLKDLKRCLTRQQRLSIYNEFGMQWEESAKMCIEAFNEELYQRKTNITFEEYIQENNHMFQCAHPKSTDDPFLDNLLEANKISKDKFCTAIHEIMDKKIDRLNTLCIEGPTTTGKSLVLKLITQNYHCGTVQRSGDHSQFFLQNLVDKPIALMEEPRITINTVNDFKELLGGNPFDIHVKHSPDVTVKRLSVLISTNHSLGAYITSIDAAAIYERCHTFQFKFRVGTPELPKPRSTLCACYFSAWYGKWWEGNPCRFDE